MKKTIFRIVATLVLSAFIGVLLLLVDYIGTAQYRKQLPPKTQTDLPEPMQAQLQKADRITRYFTTSSTLGNLAMVYHSQGDYEKAAVCYKLAIEKDENNWVWHYYLGNILLEQERPAAAVPHFTRVLEKVATNKNAIFYTALCYQRIGETPKAIMLLKRLAADHIPVPPEEPNSFPLQTYAGFQLARLYLSSHQTDSAEKILTTIIADQETFGPAYRLLAEVYTEQGRVQLAGNYRTKANDLGDYTAPPDEMLNKIALLSASEQYLLKQIQDAMAARNYQWALKLCDHAIAYYPDNKELISVAVIENFRNGADEKALSYLDKHLSYFSNDAKELMDLTDILYNRKHLQEAMKYFYQVKKLLPQNADLPVWLFERGKKDEALAMLDGQMSVYPKDNKIRATKIVMLIDLGDDTQAANDFAVLKKNDPQSADCLQIKGLLAAETGNTDSAAISYEAAYKIAPNDLIFTKKLLGFYIKNKKWATAIGHFRSALDLFPNEPFLLEGTGRLLLSCPDTMLRNTSEGIDYSKRAFISYKSSYEIKLSAGKTLAVAYLAAGDKKNCIKYINKTIALAKEINEEATYTAYFRNLIGK